MLSFDEMWNFIALAPYFISIVFAGSFLLTFTTVKVSQSDAVYSWFTAKMDLWRAKQARLMRERMMKDIASFLRKRDPKDLAPTEQKIYFQMLESYQERILRLYGARDTQEDV